jgi:hypothetical protein
VSYRTAYTARAARGTWLAGSVATAHRSCYCTGAIRQDYMEPVAEELGPTTGLPSFNSAA